MACEDDENYTVLLHTCEDDENYTELLIYHVFFSWTPALDFKKLARSHIEGNLGPLVCFRCTMTLLDAITCGNMFCWY